MLISPPFLLPQLAASTDDDRLDAEMSADWMSQCMGGDAPGQGAYPVSYLMGWHGGLHLRAPWGANGPEPVRAIADGTVAFARTPTPKPDSVAQDHELNYGGWTDNGVVVIKHTTDIGEGPNAQVSFFSIYMHLSRLDDSVREGCRIHRKDVLGEAGQICGMRTRQIHFEIGCDDDNLAKLVGRTTNLFPANTDGRVDALYGEIYFTLPAGSCVWTASPQYGQPRPEADAITVEDLVVGIRYAHGDAWVTTYRRDGTTVGERLREAGAEYGLYEQSCAISRAHAQDHPAPGAVMELLRLGRVLGPDAIPADLPHWRRIRCNGGAVWVDLNAPKVRKYSDADFPPWRGWHLVDEGGARDNRCESSYIRALVDRDQDGNVDPQEGMWALADRAIAGKLAKTICKFPGEWDAATIEARWGYLRSPNADMPEPMDADDFAQFRRHTEALSFRTADIGLPSSYWRFSPREFIRHFRQCMWLSRDEFVQLLPDHAVRTGQHGGHTQVYWEEVPVPSTREDAIVNAHRVPLNKMMRKYGIDTPMRQACFFGNAVQETSWLGSLAESYGSTLWYAPWYGRGFLQLTNPENYCNYWAWRGRNVDDALRRALVKAYADIANLPAAQRTNGWLRDANFRALTQAVVQWRDHVADATRPPKVAEDFFAPSDSAGFYWAKNRMARNADEAPTLERHAVQTNQGEKIYYRSLAFWRTSASVNLPGATGRTNYHGLNGFDSRCCAYGMALAVLAEVRFPDSHGRPTVEFPEGYERRFL